MVKGRREPPRKPESQPGSEPRRRYAEVAAQAVTEDRGRFGGPERSSACFVLGGVLVVNFVNTTRIEKGKSGEYVVICEEEYPMRWNVLRSKFFFAALFLSLAAITEAEGGNCSTAGVAGQWGYTFTGMLTLPTGAVPIAAVGIATFDAAGNFTGTQTSSVGGGVSEDKVKGTVSVNPDCTGTLDVSVFNQSGVLLRTAAWNLVVVDNGREVRAIFKRLTLANGMNVPAVITVDVRKVVPGRANEQ